MDLQERGYGLWGHSDRAEKLAEFRKQKMSEWPKAVCLALCGKEEGEPYVHYEETWT